MFDNLDNNPLAQKSEPPLTASPSPSPVSTPPVINTASPKPTSVSAPSPIATTEEFISVMPARFKKGAIANKTQAETANPELIKKKKRIVLIGLVALGVLVIFGGLIGFYFWSKNYLKKPQEPIVNSSGSGASSGKTESNELSLTAEIIDSTVQQKISSVTLFFPAGAIDPNQIVELKSLTVPEAVVLDKTYQYLGGVYKIGPSLPTLLKPITLTLVYFDNSLISSNLESDLKLAYLKDGAWVIWPAILDINTNTFTINLDAISSDTFALIIDQTKLTPINKEVQVAPQIFSAPDQDNDGLTDLEEKLYQTNVALADTDSDGIADGKEVADLSDPLHLDGTLAMSGLVKVFTNDQWSYSFFYPSSWLVKALPETDQSQMMVVTETGEFFEISIEDNFERLSPKEWYIKKATQLAPEQITETVVTGHSAAWNPDRLNLYVAKDNKIYILTYNLGVEEEASFKTTYKMLIKGFRFTDNQGNGEENMPEGKYRGNRPDGVLIKYTANPAIYLLEGAKKRPIKSEAALIKLGYNFSQVIEIPEAEWYPDGLIIE